jgi:hypothetical protein
MISAVGAAKKPLFASEVKIARLPGMDGQRANVAFDEHAVRSPREGFTAISAAPQSLADRANIKPMPYHG